jgi:hypothetical protein
VALTAEGAEIGGAVLLQPRITANGQRLAGFTATGLVQFLHAKIGADLSCQGATFQNPGGMALDAAGAEVRGTVFLNTSASDGGQHFHRFMARGMVQLLGAKIGANLVCDGATFANPGDVALSAERIVTGSAVQLRNSNIGGSSVRFTAKGTVRLFGAEIGSNFECQGALLERPGGRALDAYGLAVKGDAQLCAGFRASGLVDLRGSRVGGALDCSKASFGNILVSDDSPAQNSGSTPSQGANEDGLCLDSAFVARFIDDEASWSSEANLSIEGFVYGTLDGNPPINAMTRLRWLNCQSKAFKPQPYEQLIRVLRQMGHEADARKVAIAKQDALRRRGQLSRPGRVWNWFLGFTIGHGYKPWKALLFLLTFLVSGSGVFYYASLQGAMKPPKAESSFQQSSPDSRHCDEKYPCLNPPLYSLDTLLPIIDLQQEKFWLPDASTRIGMLSRWYLWLHIVVGYVLTSLTVVALTGLVKKD